MIIRKRVSIGALALIIILIIVGCKLIVLKSTTKEIIENKLNPSEYFGNFVICEENNKTKIGKDKKQVENDYYDICIEEEKSMLTIYINTLKIGNGKELYNDEYLESLIQCINEKYINKLNTKKLKMNIINQYINLRKSIDIQNFKNIEYIDNEFIVKIYEEKYVLIVNIKEKVDD